MYINRDNMYIYIVIMCYYCYMLIMKIHLHGYLHSYNIDKSFRFEDRFRKSAIENASKDVTRT